MTSTLLLLWGTVLQHWTNARQILWLQSSISICAFAINKRGLTTHVSVPMAVTTDWHESLRFFFKVNKRRRTGEAPRIRKSDSKIESLNKGFGREVPTPPPPLAYFSDWCSSQSLYIPRNPTTLFSSNSYHASYFGASRHEPKGTNSYPIQIG